MTEEGKIEDYTQLEVETGEDATTTLPPGTAREEVSEIFDIDELIRFKQNIDKVKGRTQLMAIGDMILFAAQKNIDNKAFEKAGFTPEVAEVLEGMSRGTATLADLADVKYLHKPRIIS